MTSVTTPPAVGGRFRPVLAMRRNLVAYAEATWRDHGDAVRTVLGPPGMDREVWLLHHPDAAARVLSGSSWRGFVKQDPVYTEVGRWLGHGLLTAEGEDWTRQKRFVQPAFTKAAVEGYAALMADEVDRVVAARTADGDGQVDLGAWMQELALRVVVRALFGESASDVLAPVRRSFPPVSETVVRRGVGVLRLPPSVPTPLVRRGRRGRADLFAACDAIVAARRRAGPDGATDLLARLVAARDGAERLSDDEIRDQVLVFLLAGHETTSTALTFALHLLGRHPDVQDAVRDETRAVLDGDPRAAGSPERLPVTTAVLRETMRLYPSAPFISRLALADDEVLGRRLPSGSTVVLVPWTIHRRPDLWTDPLRFDPGRFLGGDDHARHRYAWMPFGGGPRACIGQHFSMVEATLALGAVLRSHRVRATANRDHLPVDALITLFPTAPVRAHLERLVR